MESLWHPLNSGSGWSSSVMRLTYQTLINMVRGRRGRGRDETRKRQKRREGGEGGRGSEAEKKIEERRMRTQLI